MFLLHTNFIICQWCHPQERLEKEKKLSKDLGQAATKLQQLLKVSHEQLAKEKETVKVLKDQLLAKVCHRNRASALSVHKTHL